MRLAALLFLLLLQLSSMAFAADDDVSWTKPGWYPIDSKWAGVPLRGPFSNEQACNEWLDVARAMDNGNNYKCVYYDKNPMKN